MKKFYNILFFAILLLLFIPTTRMHIQVWINKGFALFSPSSIEASNQKTLANYNWKLIDKNEIILDFKNLKGEVVLVNFWATWCPPCIAEMPSMQALYNDYNDKIKFVLVSNEEFSVINKFLDNKKYAFEVYNPVNNGPELFNVSSIPRTFLLDKNGRIVIDKTGSANWNSESVRDVIDGLLAY